ncbi:MAG: S9 family peptidase [Sphingomonadales bacterium]|jgi:oligopeptidase B
MKLPASSTNTPHAAKKTYSQNYHGHLVEDPYHWLRDPNYPDVKDQEILDYLEAENAYFEEILAPVSGLKDKIFEELKGRLKQDDESVPVKDGDWYYWWKFRPGEQYRCWWRKSVDGGEDILLLDETKRTEGHEFYQLGAIALSPDGKYLAISEDRQGDERFEIRVRPIDGDDWQLVAEGASANIIWDGESQGLFWVELSENHRPYLVYHSPIKDSASKQEIYRESDTSFFVGINRTQSREYLVIGAGDHVTSEARLLPIKTPNAKLRLISERKSGHEYDVDHGHGQLFIRTNDEHRNFRIVAANPENPEPENWSEVIAPSDNLYIRGHTAFADFLAVEERIDGLDQIRVQSYDSADFHHVAFDEESYAVSMGANPEYRVDTIRLSYQSMVTPASVMDYALKDRKINIRKVQDIPSGYDKSAYVTERVLADARDGSKIPVSIVYRKDTPKDGSAPLHLYGYGAYGLGMNPGFSTSRLSLLDRGFIFAIAHIRGGDEMGYGWYQDGKLFKRWNTFTDFIDVARHLIAENYATKGQISISGGSAGGTLMGVAANLAPDLWRAVVAHVPFVDVLNTMLDDSLPLTPIEWPEWGNPIEDAASFAFIKSYSPYDNVVAQDYPALMVTAGLHDPRVTYWEPAKWVARLREIKTDDHPLVLKTNMGAGHGGKTGRFKALEETAEEYSFILMAFERTDT